MPGGGGEKVSVENLVIFQFPVKKLSFVEIIHKKFYTSHEYLQCFSISSKMWIMCLICGGYSIGSIKFDILQN